MEHYSVGSESLDFFRENLDRLLEACLPFKVGDPFRRSPTTIDRCAIHQASRITDAGEPLAEVLATFANEVLPASLNFGSPSFLAHPDCGNAVAALLGEMASAILQQNLASDEYSPVATIVELELLQVLRRVVGYDIEASSDGVLSAGGAFVFGGSGANFAGLLAAREALRERLARDRRRYDPRRTRVLANRPFSHYSLRRSLNLLGLGNPDLSEAELRESGLDRECLLEVQTEHFRMKYSDLEAKIETVLARGEEILSIFAIAGDSRMMAFDDIEAVTSIAERYGLWVHVDACEGGQVLFSPRRRHLMVGVERANSIALDPHKVLMLPYNLSAFLLRTPEALSKVSGGAATVIRQGDRSFGTYTPAIGSKAFISLKLWFLLKHWGWERLAAEIDRRHDLAVRAAALIRGEPALVLVNSRVDHNAVAFMYRPPDRATMSVTDLNKLNRGIQERLNMACRYFVHTFPAVDDEAAIGLRREEIWPLRMMFGNPLTTWEIVEDCIRNVIEIGQELGATG